MFWGTAYAIVMVYRCHAILRNSCTDPKPTEFNVSLDFLGSKLVHVNFAFCFQCIGVVMLGISFCTVFLEMWKSPWCVHMKITLRCSVPFYYWERLPKNCDLALVPQEHPGFYLFCFIYRKISKVKLQSSSNPIIRTSLFRQDSAWL